MKGNKTKLYLVSEEELEELIELYDIENRKEFIGDDNSLKRKRRVIYKFLESRKLIEKEFRLVASGTVYKNDLYWTIGEKLSSLTFNELIIKKYNGKNISIYISEDR